MDDFYKSILWAQFGASIEMLEIAIRACPDALWTGSRFWYISYHTLFFLDLILSDSAETFAPPAPFTLSELDPSGVFPDHPYTKGELLLYHMRHVQHHAGQLNLILSRQTGSAPRWVKQALP